MGFHNPREQRRAVFVTCRLRGDSGWSDMTICNLSAHGLMARCSDPPPRGAFIEVRKGPVTIVGQVRWSQDDRIGIRTQEPIDVPSLLDERPVPQRGVANDRRSGPRDGPDAAARIAPADLAERSRQWSRLFDWLIIAAIGIISAGLLASQVHSVIAVPFQQAAMALGR